VKANLLGERAVLLMEDIQYFNSKFWYEPFVLDNMTGEDKYFYLYLLTNSHTNHIGVYQISTKRIAFETHLSIEAVESLMERFIKQFNLILYNPDTYELAVKDWAYFHRPVDRHLVLEEILYELRRVQDQFLIQFVEGTIVKEDSCSLHDLFFNHMKTFLSDEDTDMYIPKEEVDYHIN
jgi:hypothetical protein